MGGDGGVAGAGLLFPGFLKDEVVDFGEGFRTDAFAEMDHHGGVE